MCDAETYKIYKILICEKEFHVGWFPLDKHGSYNISLRGEYNKSHKRPSVTFPLCVKIKFANPQKKAIEDKVHFNDKKFHVGLFPL